MRRLALVALVIVVIGLSLVGAGAVWVRGYLATPLAMPPEGLALDIAPGSSWSAVVHQLADDGIVQFPSILAAYGRFSGQAAKIKAG